MSDCTIRFVQQELGRDVTIQAAPGKSLLEIALANDIHIEHTCGGVGGCSTCHVWIRQGMEHLSPATDAEMDRVEEAADVRLYSRLACQAKIARAGGMIVCEIPAWNRNAVKEAPH